MRATLSKALPTYVGPSSENQDWFRFWLKDEEDPVKHKAAQYQPWRDWKIRSNRSSAEH
jgi:hypothetical protein